jgi:hypothetical protein
MDCLDREMIQITRIPIFSEEAFVKQHPDSLLLLEALKRILHEQDRILIGGPNSLFIKQCVYATLRGDQRVAPFPPSVFVESRIEMYCPGVAQFSCYPFGFTEFLDRFKETLPPTVFCEIESPEAMTDSEYFSKFDSGMPTQFILFDPFPSFESMQEALLNRQDWRRAGFKTFFVDPRGLMFMEEEPRYAKT